MRPDFWSRFCSTREISSATAPALYKLYAGLGAVLGHNFPFYLNFKGGKGIAVTSGLILMMDWRITILCLIAFALTVGLTRYVSLGSLVITALFMISWIFLGQTGRLALTPAHLLESYVLVFLIVAMAYCGIAPILSG